MDHQDLIIPSKYDGLLLHASVWLPKEEPKGIIQILHGLYEHRAYYTEFASILSHYGYIVLISDQRGHGESVDDTHPLGTFDDMNGWMMNLVDLNRFSRSIRETYRRLPFFLLGFSLGALVAHSFIKRFEYETDGVILMSCPQYQKKLMALEKMAKVAYKVNGPKKPCRLLDNLYVSGLTRRNRDNEPSKFDWLTENPHFIEQVEQDPKTQFVPSTSMVNDILFGFRDVFVYQDWHALKRNLPILILNGTEDPCSAGEAGNKQIAEHLYHAGYRNIRSKSYNGMRHILLQEEERQLVYGDIIVFLNRILEESL